MTTYKMPGVPVLRVLFPENQLGNINQQNLTYLDLSLKWCKQILIMDDKECNQLGEYLFVVWYELVSKLLGFYSLKILENFFLDR